MSKIDEFGYELQGFLQTRFKIVFVFVSNNIVEKKHMFMFLQYIKYNSDMESAIKYKVLLSAITVLDKCSLRKTALKLKKKKSKQFYEKL